MTDFADLKPARPSNTQYEPPRAVRLRDTTTAEMACRNGIIGTPDVCLSGMIVKPGGQCVRGNRVVIPNN